MVDAEGKKVLIERKMKEEEVEVEDWHFGKMPLGNRYRVSSRHSHLDRRNLLRTSKQFDSTSQLV